MKSKIKVAIIVLVVILVSIVSFVGVYHKDKNKMVNYLPDYTLDSTLVGYRKLVLTVDESSLPSATEETKNEENTTAENTVENTVENVAATEENATTEENVVNETENTTSEEKKDDKKAVNYENLEIYKSAVAVYRNRLKTIGVVNYTVSYDENTGDIEINIPENDQTDTIYSDLTQIGKFEIKDSETQETLINNDDVSSVKVKTVEQKAGTTTVYLDIQFNVKGTNKYSKITEKYQNKTENVEVSNDENNTDTAASTESTDKTVDLVIDGQKLLSTDFDSISDNGNLQLTIGSADSTNYEEINTLRYGGLNIAGLMENDPLPCAFNAKIDRHVGAVLSNKDIMTIVYIEIAIAVIIAGFIIAKYKAKGILATVISVGFLAILLIVIRYANVTLSIDGLFGIGLVYIINSVFAVLVFENVDTKESAKKQSKALVDVIKKYTLIVIPEIITAFICCLAQWESVYSIGMVMFWGVLISWIYNTVVAYFLKNNK